MRPVKDTVFPPPSALHTCWRVVSPPGRARDLRIGVDVVAKRQISCPSWKTNSDLPPVVGQYTDLSVRRTIRDLRKVQNFTLKMISAGRGREIVGYLTPCRSILFLHAMNGCFYVCMYVCTWCVQVLRFPKEAFAAAMQSWRERCEKCVCLQGDYVEKLLHFQLPVVSSFF